MIRVGGKTVQVVQPRAIETMPANWTNAMGAQFQGQGVVATFAYDDFTLIPPAADLEVLVIGGAYERICKIDAKTRASIQ